MFSFPGLPSQNQICKPLQMKRYSYDDQYNIITNKHTSSNNNHKITKFLAIDYFQFEFNELQLHNTWKLINQLTSNPSTPSTSKENSTTADDCFTDAPVHSCFIPQSTTSIERLENLIWRKWTKVKYDLKELDPVCVNWQKDYDITWLYGPLASIDNGGVFKQDDDDDDKVAEEKEEEVKTQFNNRNGSFSSLSTSTTLDSDDFDNDTIVFVDDDEEVDNGETHPKPILKTRRSNGPLDFERFWELDVIKHNHHHHGDYGYKSVSFNDMVQIRQFY